MGTQREKKRPAAFWILVLFGCVSLLAFAPRIIDSISSVGVLEGFLLPIGIIFALVGTVFGVFAWWLQALNSKARKTYGERFLLQFAAVPDLAPAVRRIEGATGVGTSMLLVFHRDQLRILKGLGLFTVASIPMSSVHEFRVGETPFNFRSIACVDVEVATEAGTLVIPVVPGEGLWRVIKGDELSALVEALNRKLVTFAGRRDG